jgi:hypothetical protein
MSIRHFTEDELRILGIEVCGERRARSPYTAGLEEDGLVGTYGMAMRTEKTRETDGADE